MNNIQQLLQTLIVKCNALYAVLADSNSGMVLGQAQSGSNKRLDLELIAAGTTDIVRSDDKTSRLLNFDHSDEILFNQASHFHIIHRAINYPGLYIVTGIDKKLGNLALLRREVDIIDLQLRF